jgi:hypothetical protein
MMQVPIQQLPNQSFSIALDSNQWAFTLKTCQDTTVASLTLNGTVILDSARCAAGSFIIPSRYEESGNFFFVTQNDQLPHYTQFNVMQSLIYISAAELAALRTAKTLPLAATDFNPIAALPLRFSPQNYRQA